MNQVLWITKVETFLERLASMLELDESTKKEFKQNIYTGLFGRIGDEIDGYLSDEERVEIEALLKTKKSDDTPGMMEVINTVVERTVARAGGSIAIGSILEDMVEKLIDPLKDRLTAENLEELAILSNFSDLEKGDK